MNIFKKDPAYILSFSKNSFLILRIGLPIILLYFSFFLITILSTPDIPGYALARIHFNTLEHIVMSTTLVISGAFLIDLAEKHLRN